MSIAVGYSSAVSVSPPSHFHQKINSKEEKKIIVCQGQKVLVSQWALPCHVHWKYYEWIYHYQIILHLPLGIFEGQKCELRHLRYIKGKSQQLVHGIFNVNGRCLKRQLALFASSEELQPNDELNSVDLEQEELLPKGSEESSSHILVERTGGKAGFISFYGHPYRKRAETVLSCPSKGGSDLFLFIGPAAVVASLVFPSLYLRRILSTVFEDSLLTDFLILFFTEALFYSGVAVFIILIDHVQRQRPLQPVTSNNYSQLGTGIGLRISSVATLVLSLIIPMVTMGFVWPWTGPAASATLAPYLVGIVVQFAFEKYARYRKSSAWPVIPVIFQVYRLHQLNRAAQLVTALSFSVRGAETNSQTLAINSSLGTLLNVLQFLGVVCIWSLSSFLMRFFPSPAVTPDP